MMIYYTIPYITHGLVCIIDTAEREPEGFRRMNFKRELLLGLEKVALCIELHLPSQFHHHDSITDAWLRERTKQWSTALREKKKWILTPKEDTLEYFVESITFILICFVDGNWDALERIEPVKIARPPLRKSITTFLLHALKTILKIAIPVVSLLVLQQTPLALTGATLVSVISMLSLYAVTILASDLNPDFNARISNVKDIMSLLPGNGSKL